jgi:hypothetical protein
MPQDVPYGAPPPMTVLPPGTKMKAAPEYRPASVYDDEEMFAPGGPFKLNDRAFDAWLAALPESENVEDRRNLYEPPALKELERDMGVLAKMFGSHAK